MRKLNQIDPKAILILIIGTLFTAGFTYLTIDQEKEKNLRRFEAIVSRNIYILEESLKTNTRMLDNILSLYKSSTSVSRQEFHQFTAPILKNYPFIQALEWVPYVKQEERKTLKAQAKEDGFKNFRFTEYKNNKMVLRTKQDKYYPVFYMEPLKGNEPALGFDLFSHPERRKTLLESIEKKSFHATAKITLVQENEKQAGMLIFAPFFKGQKEVFEGFILGVYRIGDMLEEMLGKYNSKGVNLLIYDGHKEDTDDLIYGNEEKDSFYTLKKVISISNRDWTLIWQATPSFYSESISLVTILGSIMIFAFSVAVSIIVQLLFAKNMIIEKQMKLRTTQLEEANLIIDKQRAQKTEQAKLAALGEMAASVAHEINNPLTIIITKTKQLKKYLIKENIEDLKLVSGLEKLDETAFRISKIVKGLTHITGDSEKEDFRDYKIENLIKETIGLCGEKFKNNGIDLELDFQSTDTLVNCKSIEIGQVILNILNNAFDAVIEVEDKWVKVITQKKQNKIILRILDSGKGINPKLSSKIFSPFYTTKEIGKGTGLGLSISQRIITNHGGTLSVEDGINTCFKITLPCLQVLL